MFPNPVANNYKSHVNGVVTFWLISTSVIDSENTNPDKRAIHIHGRMEHNLAKYAKYYCYGNTKILSSEFIRKN